MPLKLKKKGKTWHVDGYVNGERYRKSTGTTSREHAEAYRKERERDLEDRAYHHSASFADALDIYLEKGGEDRYVQPLLDNLGATRLRDITPSVASALATKLYGHCQPLTVRRHFYTPLNAIMRKASTAHLCPLVIFEAPKGKRKPVDYADDVWLRSFLEHAFARIALTVLFMTLSGARVTESCHLRVGDLNLAQGVAILRKTKNGKSRKVSLAPELVDVLRNWIVDQKLFEPGLVVFGYASRFSVNQAIERVCDKINLEAGAIRFVKIKNEQTGKMRKVRDIIGPLAIKYLSSHKVGRHAFAARLLLEGKSLKLLQQAGDWSSIQLVADTYGHLEQSAVDQTLRETGSALFTKMGSPALESQKPGTDGQVLDTRPNSDEMVESIRNRHLPMIAGGSDGGRCRDRTCDPTRVKMGVTPTPTSKTPEKPEPLHE